MPILAPEQPVGREGREVDQDDAAVDLGGQGAGKGVAAGGEHDAAVCGRGARDRVKLDGLF